MENENSDTACLRLFMRQNKDNMTEKPIAKER
jgi:hypothetical protein